MTGNPIRAELLGGDPAVAIKALEWAGHDPRLPTVYVTGGAQGTMADAARQLGHPHAATELATQLLKLCTSAVN